jgi:hypothetical protein
MIRDVHRQTLKAAGVMICLGLIASVALSGQGRGGRGGAPAAASDPREFSGYWELPPDGRDGRNIPAAVLAAGVTKAQLDRIAAHDAKGIAGATTWGCRT